MPSTQASPASPSVAGSLIPGVDILALHAAQRQTVADFAKEPRIHSGRGIVTCLFDKGFATSWVLLSELGRLQVSLPIEAFHRPGELSSRNIDLATALAGSLGLNLTIRLIEDSVESYAIKPFAIWRSAFREVLWLDGDNFPIRDPALLFDDPEYKQKGSLFWRDVSGADRARFWHAASPVWALFNVPPNDSEEFDTGQLLLDKERCWSELGLTLYFNRYSATYYRFVWGDKDTFRLAFQNLAAAANKPMRTAWSLAEPDKVPYGFMPYGPFHMGRPNSLHKWGGGSVMVQRDRDGAPLFNHRNTDKFSLTDENIFNADIANEAIYHGHIATLKKLLATA